MGKILLLGEAMVLLTAQEFGALNEVSTFSKSLAGAEVNVAIGLSRLGHHPEYVTKLSLDPLAQYIKDYLIKESIGTTYLSYDYERATGLMMKNRVKTGDPSTAYFRKGSAASNLSITDIEHIDFDQIDLLHMTGIPPALSKETRQACFYLLQQAKAKDVPVTFDPNLRPTLWENEQVMIETLNEMADYADVVLPGISEAEVLVGSRDIETIGSFYLQKGTQAVIIKNGADGAALMQVGKEKPQHIGGYKVTDIIDTVGAGDGFAVGVISAIIEGLSLEEAVKRGNAIGSIQLTSASDNEALPTREDLALYMNGQK